MTASTIKAVDWNNVSARVEPFGLNLRNIQSISFEETVTSEYQYGAGNKPLDYTSGQVEFGDATMSLAYNQWLALKAELGSLDQIRSGKRQFDLLVTVRSSDDANNPTAEIHTLQGCKIIGQPYTFEQGAAPVSVEITFKFLDHLMSSG